MTQPTSSFDFHILDDALAGASSPCYIGLSGGLDSMVLLALCATHQREVASHEFIAVHVNHGLQRDSDEWQQVCVEQCQRDNIECLTASVKVDPSHTQGLEAAARDARYQAFSKHIPASSTLLLAHHGDDQAESLILGLTRANGLVSAAGIPHQRDINRSVQICRPLLSISRGTLEAYARDNSLTWVEDPSNQDAQYDRNFVRHHIMPLLKQRWPDFSRIAQRQAERVQESTLLLQEACEEKLETIQSGPSQLSMQTLASYSPAWQRELLKTWLHQQGAAPFPQHALTELNQFFTAAEDKQPEVSWRSWALRRFQDQLWLVDTSPVMPPEEIQIANPLTRVWQSNGYLLRAIVHPDIQSKLSSVRLEPVGHSVRFKPWDQDVSKPLKQWFKHWQIPPWKRKHWWMLVVDEGEAHPILALMSDEQQWVSSVLGDSEGWTFSTEEHEA